MSDVMMSDVRRGKIPVMHFRIKDIRHDHIRHQTQMFYFHCLKSYL